MRANARVIGIEFMTMAILGQTIEVRERLIMGLSAKDYVQALTKKRGSARAMVFA
jgi:hypothetical protein